jgi:hypothetical protein
VPPSTIPFKDAAISNTNLYNFIVNNLPEDYSTFTTPQELEEFIGDKNDKDLNKVILFNAKVKIPRELKALANEFKGLLSFAVVPKESHS